jgi:hypothetical protein
LIPKVAVKTVALIFTNRSSMHDAIQGYPTWSSTYGGRGITHQGVVDLANGIPLEEVAASFQKAMETGDESRLVTWAYVVPLERKIRREQC